MTEAIEERIAIMLESIPDITTAQALHAARAYRGQEPMYAQQLARRAQDAGYDGRQVMRTVRWIAGQL